MRNATMVGICLGVACATAPRDPGPVRVFEVDAALAEDARRLPGDCRLLKKLPSFEQMESERVAHDPYRRQRRETAARGGNVLLVLSKALTHRPSLECPSGDRSPGCLADSRSWYRVSFETYACSAEAVQKLEAQAEAASSPGWIFSWRLGGSGVSVEQMKARVLAMQTEGVGTDVIVTYVGGQRLKRKLSADDIIDWKRAGIPDEVIRIAAAR